MVLVEEYADAVGLGRFDLYAGMIDILDGQVENICMGLAIAVVFR